MAVGAVTNSIQMTRSITADMQRIKPGNGFFTEIRTVKWPNWDRDNIARCLSLPRPALLFWRDHDIEDVKMKRSTDLRPTYQIYAMGLIDAAPQVDLQELRDLLHADMVNVWLSNTERNWPGSTMTNTWGGLETYRAPGFPTRWRHWGETDTNADVGGFESMWHVNGKSPIGG